MSIKATNPKKDRHAVANIKSIESDTKLRWYIVQTYVGFEDSVKKSIEQIISNQPSLKEKINEIFIPTKAVLKLNRKGEREEKYEKIYPGYIYIQMKLDKDTGYIIQNTQHVSRITGTGDYAVSLEDGYVEKLKTQLIKDSENVTSTTKVTYKIGDLIQVMDGPFKDMRGKVNGIDVQNSRIIVLLTIFDRETNVEFDVLEVKRVL